MLTIRDIKEEDRQEFFAMAKEFYGERHVITIYRRNILRELCRSVCEAEYSEP